MVKELEGARDHIASVLVAPTGEALLASPALAQVEVALVDLCLPGISGAQTITRLTEVAPRVRSVALTVFDDASSVFDAIGAGAVGYLLKTEPFDRLLQAIVEAADRQHPVSARVAGYLLNQLGRDSTSPLTERELELALVLAEGASYADCASRLQIALGTVQHHVKSIYRKLDINSKQEVRSWVQRRAPKA